MEPKSCCFTGHRKLESPEAFFRLVLELKLGIMIEKGMTDFYAGGALGWDTLCAQTVLYLRRRKYPNIHLHLILPCPPEEQTAKWTDEQKKTYRKIMKAADTVEIVSEHYTPDCMKKRNQRLVELADYCICYYNERRHISGTGQTVRMVLKKGIRVLNMYTPDEDIKKYFSK